MSQLFQSCRICHQDMRSREGIKYGTRHYAHFACYLDAGKKLTDLHVWQVGMFPWRLLVDRDLMAEVERIMKKDPDFIALEVNTACARDGVTL